MARIKVNLPEKFTFKCTIPVRITDINYGGHVGNDSILSIVHEARLQYLDSIGYSEMTIEGAGIIMSDAAIEFKGESFYKDILEISISIGEITKVGFDIYYKIETTRQNKNILVAKAKTGMVCYDYTAAKVASLPEKFIEKIRL